MSVRLSNEVEEERLRVAAEQRKKPIWEHYRTLSIVEALHKAREMGWAENKVQVRWEQTYLDAPEYIVEPYEKDCGCSSILKYKDYFGMEEKDDL